MRKSQSFETLQQLDFIQNKQYLELAKIIEDLIDEIQQCAQELLNTQNKQPLDENRQDRLQKQIEFVVKRVDEQCQNYAKYTLDYLFQLNSNNFTPSENQLKNMLISIKLFLKKQQNKGFIDKLRAQLNIDALKINQTVNSKQYYEEIKKKLGEADSPLLKKYRIKREKEEGFISGDSEETVSEVSEKQIRSPKKNNKNTIQEEGKRVASITFFDEDDDDQDTPFKLKQLIKQQEAYIMELKEKVANRECILSEITYGYMKDVSHWKELFNRKNQDFSNCFEVSYFEPSIIYDDKIREILNSRLSDLKIQCENKVNQMQKKFKKLQDDHEKLQSTLYAFMTQNDPVSIAKTLFTLETNPHKIWKILQDQVGNVYFFRIFESQRPGFGIKYKEIDELIASSKASTREYDEFKKHMKFQMEKLVERSQQEIEFIRTEVSEKEKEMEQIRKGFSQDIENARLETIKQMELQFTAREEKLYEEFEERRKDIYEQLGNRNFEKIIEDSQIKVVFQKWLFAAKLMKIKSILDEQNDSTIEQKQNFLQKFILRQISKPTLIQSSKKINELPGSLFNSKRFGKLKRQHSMLSQNSRTRLQSDMTLTNENIEKSPQTEHIVRQKNFSLQQHKFDQNFKLDSVQKIESIIQIESNFKVESKNELRLSEKEIKQEAKLSIPEVLIRKVQEEDEDLCEREEKQNQNENQNQNQNQIYESDIDQIFELEKEIDILSQQLKEKQSLLSGLEGEIGFLNKQVSRVTQELQHQRDYNAQIKHENRQNKLKINLYEDTFNEIAKKIGFGGIKIDVSCYHSLKTSNAILFKYRNQETNKIKNQIIL